jgi:site-specific DNA recombinase
MCGRRMESAWSNGKAAYRCRHGRTSAMAPDPARPKNTYVREDNLLPHLQALHLLLTTPAVRARRRTRAGADVRDTASPGDVIAYLREHEIALTWNPAAATVKAVPRGQPRQSRSIKSGAFPRTAHSPPARS